MRRTTLALRLNRRAIGAAVLEDDRLSVVDGRHLTSRHSRAVASAERYVKRLLELATPTAIVIDAPFLPASTTAVVLTLVVDLAKAAGIAARVVRPDAMLSAFSVSALRSRRALRGIVENWWPETAALKQAVKPFVVDAAALALWDEVDQALRTTAS